MYHYCQCPSSLPGQHIHHAVRTTPRREPPWGVPRTQTARVTAQHSDDYTPQDKINDVVWACLRPRHSFASHETVCVQQSKTVAFFISSDRLFACFKEHSQYMHDLARKILTMSLYISVAATSKGLDVMDDSQGQGCKRTHINLIS